jgi:hypothetical protein
MIILFRISYVLRDIEIIVISCCDYGNIYNIQIEDPTLAV